MIQHRVKVILLVITLAEYSGAYSNYECYGGFFNDELCPSPSVINVTGATYGVSDCRDDNSKACCPKESDCQIPATREYLQTIKTECNGKQQCGSLRAPWTSTMAECGVSGMSDYVTIHYECLQRSCLGSFVDGELCTSPYMINVTGANYCVSDCNATPTKCCPKTDDCVIPMTEGDEYLQSIKSNCNGRQSCVNLPVRWTPANALCGVKMTDYISIDHECIPYLTTVTPDETSTSDSGSIQNQNSGIAVGITTGMNIVLLIVIVIMVGILLKHSYTYERNKNQVSEREKVDPEINRRNETQTQATASHASESTNGTSNREAYEHLDNHAFIEESGKPYATLNLQAEMPASGHENIDTKENLFGSEACIPNKDEHHSYIDVIGTKEFMIKHTSAIPQSYLEVPFSGEKDQMDKEAEEVGENSKRYEVVSSIEAVNLAEACKDVKLPEATCSVIYESIDD